MENCHSLRDCPHHCHLHARCYHVLRDGSPNIINKADPTMVTRRTTTSLTLTSDIANEKPNITMTIFIKNSKAHKEDQTPQIHPFLKFVSSLRQLWKLLMIEEYPNFALIWLQVGRLKRRGICEAVNTTVGGLEAGLGKANIDIVRGRKNLTITKIQCMGKEFFWLHQHY